MIVDRGTESRLPRGGVARFGARATLSGPEPVDTRTPSGLLGQQEALHRLLGRLNELPEDYRQAILLAKIEGLDTRRSVWASLASRWPFSKSPGKRLVRMRGGAEHEPELRLARSFAEILDGLARGEDTPELAGELATLAEIIAR